MGFIAGLISLGGVFDAPVFKTNRSELQAIHRLKREGIYIYILEVVTALCCIYSFAFV